MHVTKVFCRLLCLQAVHVTDVAFRAGALAVFIDVQLRRQTLTCSRCRRRRRAGTYDPKVASGGISTSVRGSVDYSPR